MTKKFQYETVIYELKTSILRWDFGSGDQKYLSIINAKAEQGWRLVSAFVPPAGAYGVGRTLHLIFEREV